MTKTMMELQTPNLELTIYCYNRCEGRVLEGNTPTRNERLIPATDAAAKSRTDVKVPNLSTLMIINSKIHLKSRMSPRMQPRTQPQTPMTLRPMIQVTRKMEPRVCPQLY